MQAMVDCVSDVSLSLKIQASLLSSVIYGGSLVGGPFGIRLHDGLYILPPGMNPATYLLPQ